jgi:hypothetical protein
MSSSQSDGILRVREVILNEVASARLDPAIPDLGNPMFTRTQEITVASFRRPSQGMDEAMTAGIAATACSVIILAMVWLVMHALPVSIG